MNVEIRTLNARVHRVPLLHDISFSVNRGECLGLVGPNGSGKSTLLRCLAGLHPLQSGAVMLDGVPLGTMRAQIRARKIALVEQHSDTSERLSVRDTVELGRTPFLSPLRGWSPDDDRQVERALDAVDLQDFGHRLWHTLSGGERQRAHIARALAQTPEFLLLDEPTNHLDIHHQLGLLKLVGALPITRVIALHDLNQALRCDKLAVIDHGRLVGFGKPAEVLDEGCLRQVFGVEASHETGHDGALRLHFHRAL